VWGIGSDSRVTHTAIREAMRFGHDPRNVREWPLTDLELLVSPPETMRETTDVQ